MDYSDNPTNFENKKISKFKIRLKNDQNRKTDLLSPLKIKNNIISSLRHSVDSKKGPKRPMLDYN